MPLPDLAESLSSRTEAPRQDGAKFLSVHTCTIFLHNSFVFHTYAILARNSFVSHTCARRRKKALPVAPRLCNRTRQHGTPMSNRYPRRVMLPARISLRKD